MQKLTVAKISIWAYNLCKWRNWSISIAITACRTTRSADILAIWFNISAAESWHSICNWTAFVFHMQQNFKQIYSIFCIEINSMLIAPSFLVVSITLNGMKRFYWSICYIVKMRAKRIPSFHSAMYSVAIDVYIFRRVPGELVHYWKL